VLRFHRGYDFHVIHHHFLPVEILEYETRVRVVAHEEFFRENQVANRGLIIVLSAFETHDIQRDEQPVILQPGFHVFSLLFIRNQRRVYQSDTHSFRAVHGF